MTWLVLLSRQAVEVIATERVDRGVKREGEEGVQVTVKVKAHLVGEREGEVAGRRLRSETILEFEVILVK